jgi:hypothetical protein
MAVHDSHKKTSTTDGREEHSAIHNKRDSWESMTQQTLGRK